MALMMTTMPLSVSVLQKISPGLRHVFYMNTWRFAIWATLWYLFFSAYFLSD